MSIYIGIGQIGDGGMAPITTTYNNKPFRRCSVWVDNPFGEIQKDQDGNEIIGYNNKPQRKRDVIQLIFNTDDSGKKLFENMVPGRKILFIGRLSHRPRAAVHNGKSTRKELLSIGGQQIEAFENAIVHVMRIEFIDPSLVVTLERYKTAAIENGLTEEEANKFTSAVLKQLSNHNNDNNNETPAENTSDQEVPPADGDDDDIPF